MRNLLIIKNLYENLFSLDQKKSQYFFTDDSTILGKSSQLWIKEQIFWAKEHYFSKFENLSPEINVFSFDLSESKKVIRVFNGTTLILEEEIIFENNLIKGTPYSIDCFGKLIFNKNICYRGLVIQAPIGKKIVKILFKNPFIKYDFHNGASFDKDNFQVSKFIIENDDFQTKIEKISFYFSDGTKETRHIICRGKDFPFFVSSKHMPTIKKNQLILQQPPNNYYFIYIGNKYNHIEYMGKDLKQLDKIITVDFDITYARLCVDGPAFEYEINCD